MIFSKIKNFIKDNKKIFYYLWFFVIVYLISSDFAFAVETPPTTDWWEKWVKILDWFLMWWATLVWVFTYFITLFLEPGWINWTLFWLNTHFKDIWILMSNIVYFIFAFILIWIAFMNIIGKWEKWELKQALPKFIIWVLIVPFSWFFVQLILSISAILTVSALSLPYDTFNDFKTRMDQVEIPSNCYVDMTSSWTTSWTQNGFFHCDQSSKIKLWQTLKNTPFWLISIYSYWILNLDKIDEIREKEISVDTIKNVWDLVVKILFNFLFVIVYLILFITLWIVLAVRWMYLWIYTMLSPIFWLMYFFDKKDWWWDWIFAKFNLKEFIALSMVPVYVMLALSFWLLFISVILTWVTSKDNQYSNKINLTDNNNWSDTMTIIWDWNNWKNFTLTVKWPIWWIEKAKQYWDLIKAWADWVLWVIWTMILNLMWVVVLRISIMAALRTSDITKAVTQPIYDFGNQVWSLMAKSPQYAPIFGGQSMQSMQRIWSSVEWHYQSKASTKASDFLKNTPFWDSAKSISELQKIRSNLDWKWKNSPDWLKLSYEKLLKETWWRWEKLWQDKEYQQTLFKIMESAWVKVDWIESWKNIDSKTKVWEIIHKIDEKEKYKNFVPWWVWKNTEKTVDDEVKRVNASNYEISDNITINQNAKINIPQNLLQFDVNWNIQSGLISNIAQSLYTWEIKPNTNTEIEFEQKLKELWIKHSDINKIKDELKKIAKSNKLEMFKNE